MKREKEVSADRQEQPPRIGRMVELGEVGQERVAEKRAVGPRVGKMIEQRFWEQRMGRRFDAGDHGRSGKSPA
ncbi:MAG: hypothetical protein HY744_07660 [Deltaproteobacteria bacterium]|nr:hypothetical protein [Deltaproteobacteria bacterium]